MVELSLNEKIKLVLFKRHQLERWMVDLCYFHRLPKQTLLDLFLKQSASEVSQHFTTVLETLEFQLSVPI